MKPVFERFPGVATGVVFISAPREKSFGDLRSNDLFEEILSRFSLEDALVSSDVRDSVYTVGCVMGTALTPVMLFKDGMPELGRGVQKGLKFSYVSYSRKFVIHGIDPAEFRTDAMTFWPAESNEIDRFGECLSKSIQRANVQGHYLIVFAIAAWDMNFDEFTKGQRAIFDKLGYVCNKRKGA